jgi:uncharacterized membrane protein required for colicin V production
VTSLDWIIVALTLAAAFAGYAQGFVVGAATLAGFAGGLFLGGRLGAAVTESGSQSPYAPLFALGGALLGGLLLGSLMETVGHGMRRRVSIPGLGVVDGMGGALLSGAVALGLAWLAGAVALQTPGARTFRDEIQRSTILRTLNHALPPSGPVLNALARFDPFPRIDGPSAGVPAPRAAIARDADVQQAARGVVKIQGTACGLGVEGSGWIARPRGDQRPRRGRPERHDRPARRRGRPAARAGGRLRPAQRRRSAAGRWARRARAAARRRPDPRPPGGDPRLPRERPL